MRLYFRDLPSYQDLTEAQKLHPLYSPNLSFNLDRLPAALRNDFAAFIFDRAEALSYLSLRTEAEQFHSLADFITDSCPLLTKLTELPLERSGAPSKALDPQNRQTALLHKNPR